MDNKKIIWLNGKLVSIEKAKIPFLSPTCLYGLNVFEVVRCYLDITKKQLLAFRLEDHLERLFYSAKVMRLNPKYTISEIKKFFREIIIINKYKEDTVVRMVFFVNKLGSWDSEYKSEMAIIPNLRRRVEKFDIGIHCCISSWERIYDNSLSPRIKTGANYINSRIAQIEARNNGYDSALFLNKNKQLAEAPGACIFIVRKGKLITPPVTASILESITRDTIIKISQNELGLSVVEREIDRTELYICEEAFLCGTTMEIVPIISIDKIPIGEGKEGLITKELKSKYFDIVRGKNLNYKDWLFPIY